MELRSLGLDRTQVTDYGCAILVAASDSGALPWLWVIGYDGTSVSDAAIEAVDEALKRNPPPELDDGIPTSGAAMEAVHEALARLPALERLTLDDLPASDEATAAVYDEAHT